MSLFGRDKPERRLWRCSLTLLVLVVLSGCSSLEALIIRERAADQCYRRNVGTYLRQRLEEKMHRPPLPASPVMTAPEGLDRG